MGGGAEETYKKCVVYGECIVPLPVTDVEKIFLNVNSEKISTIPPRYPKSCEYYVYRNTDATKQKDWTADGYFWRNKGSYKYPKRAKIPIINSRQYWLMRDSDDNIGDRNFQRRIYINPHVNLVLVHYTGDETLFIPRAHGNARISQSDNFIRTLPSVNQQIRITSIEKQPSEIYKEMVTQNKVSGEYQGVLNPRNIRQIKNQQSNERQRRKLSRDEIYSTVELHYHLDKYIHDLAIVPELRCIVASSELLTELNKLLAVKSDETLYMSYDTTFLMGDFFVSTLVFRHVLFKGNRIIPAAFSFTTGNQ